ncbi:putative ADP-ribosylation factor GTPase-activating protein AGD14 [Nannochloris sp. 'desiccata']|nr:putative ADP-ribosylation factor GTPase-activating protein AGD14 [Chlorella desiccata (nom. nud.)]
MAEVPAMSAFQQKSLEAKHDKILKELSRVAANRRCVDCDNIGPQYVITSYAVFVCTACGGLHRQYGHRVKGISMSKFSKEEIAEIQTGGNEKFMATFCAKWTAAALPRPTDRNPERTKAWIEEVYQNKKYFSAGTGADGDGGVENTGAPPISQETNASSSQANVHGTPSANGNGVDSTIISNDKDVVHELTLTDLGAGMAKLQVGNPVTSFPSASASEEGKPPPAALPKLHMPMPLPGSALASPAVKAVSSPAKSQVASPQPAAVTLEPMAVPEPLVAAVSTAAAAPNPSIMDAWDPFGAVEGPVASTPEAAAVPAPVAHGSGPSNAAVEDVPSGWDAFAEQGPVDAVSEEKDASSSPFAAAPVVPPPALAPGWAVDFGSQPSVPAPPRQQPAPAPVSSPPPVIPGRKEISLDTFYPEFESIRATGVLPTGQPLLQAQMTQWGVSPYSQQQKQHAPQDGQRQFASGIVLPASAAGGHTYHPGGLPSPGYAHLSPQQQQQQQQFHQQQQHGMYPAGIPTGAYYPAPSPVYGQTHQQYVSPSMQQQHMPMPMQSPSPQPLPSPAASAVSFGRPASGASTASSQGKVGTDPFAHFSPPGVGNQGQMHAATPTPFLPSPPPVAVSAPNAVVPGSQTQAASATLFGTGTSLTAYDLSAPAAPKPRASGNPFG